MTRVKQLEQEIRVLKYQIETMRQNTSELIEEVCRLRRRLQKPPDSITHFGSEAMTIENNLCKNIKNKI